MRVIFLCMLLSVAGSARGEEGSWAPMSGTQITDALSGRKLHYATAWQVFHSSGRTLYHAGRDSWGYWEVRGDQYCSMWPPQGLWECYGMARNGDSLRFIGDAGDVTDGVLAD